MRLIGSQKGGAVERRKRARDRLDCARMQARNGGDSPEAKVAKQQLVSVLLHLVYGSRSHEHVSRGGVFQGAIAPLRLLLLPLACASCTNPLDPLGPTLEVTVLVERRGASEVVAAIVMRSRRKRLRSRRRESR